MRKLLVFIAFFNFFSICMAMTGNEIIQMCQDAIKLANNNSFATNYYRAPDQFYSYGFCSGYVSSAVDQMYGILICPPIGSIYGQYMRIFTKYLNNHPEKLNLTADELIYLALKDIFPCSKVTYLTQQPSKK